LKKIVLLLALLCLACTLSFELVTFKARLPNTLYEVSGIEMKTNSDTIWMINDSGNTPRVYAVNIEGEIVRTVKLDAKNKDWEDLTFDSQGNLYIGNFGNNYSKRKNLAILKVSDLSASKEETVKVEKISFSYEDQTNFPPKKKRLYFDCESLIHFNDSLYLFTKSRVKGDFGQTNLYKIPAKKGNHVAKKISSFNTCPEFTCWITAADISPDGKKVVLLTSNSVWLFENFKDDDFFSGTATQLDLGFDSQKESICFKDNNTLYITDERSRNFGANLYEFSLN
jgi:hypothetical protein